MRNTCAFKVNVYLYSVSDIMMMRMMMIVTTCTCFQSYRAGFILKVFVQSCALSTLCSHLDIHEFIEIWGFGLESLYPAYTLITMAL